MEKPGQRHAQIVAGRFAPDNPAVVLDSTGEVTANGATIAFATLTSPYPDANLYPYEPDFTHKITQTWTWTGLTPSYAAFAWVFRPARPALTALNAPGHLMV